MTGLAEATSGLAVDTTLLLDFFDLTVFLWTGWPFSPGSSYSHGVSESDIPFCMLYLFPVTTTNYNPCSTHLLMMVLACGDIMSKINSDN